MAEAEVVEFIDVSLTDEQILQAKAAYFDFAQRLAAEADLAESLAQDPAGTLRGAGIPDFAIAEYLSAQGFFAQGIGPERGGIPGISFCTKSCQQTICEDTVRSSFCCTKTVVVNN